MRVVQSKMRTEATGFHKVAENVSSRYPQVCQCVCVCAGVYTDVIVCVCFAVLTVIVINANVTRRCCKLPGEHAHPSNQSCKLFR